MATRRDPARRPTRPGLHHYHLCRPTCGAYPVKLRGARGAAGEVAGLAPALAGTVDRALRAEGGPLSMRAPQTMFNVSIGGARHFAARTWPLERIRLLAKHADATVNDIILAMSAGALRSYLHDLGALPTDPLIAMVPVSLRPNPSGTDGSLERKPDRGPDVQPRHPPARPRPPARHRAHLHARRQDALRTMSPAQVLAMSALGAAPLGVEMLLGRRGPQRPPFNLVISNVPGPEPRCTGTAPASTRSTRCRSLSPDKP